MRRQQREERLKKKPKLVLILLLTILIILFTLVFVFWYKVSILPKFTYVEKAEDGGAYITIVDSRIDKIIRYKVEPNKVFVSSRGLGEYKLESLWILGKKEGYGGELIANSITSNYLAPVYLWRDGGSDNLNLYQKIKVFLISKRGIEVDRVLNEFELPNSILINFIVNDIQESAPDFYVDDFTGDIQTIQKVSAIVGTLGTKVSGYTKGYDENLDCEVSGSNKISVREISKIFGCEIKDNDDSESIKLRIGAKFSARF